MHLAVPVMTPASAHGIAAQSASGARPITANDIVQKARVAAWDTYQAEDNGMVRATREPTYFNHSAQQVDDHPNG